MNMRKELIKDRLALSDLSRRQAIFAMIFVLQNRLQTAGDKLLSGISMKQWLLLAVVAISSHPPTLTQAGEMMGCSRQNAKKLAASLVKKGLVALQRCEGRGNAVCIALTDHFSAHQHEHSLRYGMALDLLFEDFESDEVSQLFSLFLKLEAGICRLEAIVPAGHHKEHTGEA